MDLITLALAKKYTDEKAGYAETVAPITFDGDETGKEILDTSTGRFVKIADAQTDVSKATKVTIRAGEDEIAFSGNQLAYRSEQFQGNTISALLVSVDNEEVQVAISTFEGTYVLSNLGADHVARIEFAETIHTIDPKFIPGAVLPVVELSTYPTTPNESVEMTAEECAALDRAAAMDSNYALFDIIDNKELPGCVILRKMSTEGFSVFYGYPYIGATVALALSNENGKWSMAMVI